MNTHPHKISFGHGVSVSAAGRLHLGFFDLNGGMGRRFGSMGLAIEGPRTTVRLSRAGAPRATGPDAERAGRYLVALEDRCGLAGPHDLQVSEVMPSHAGLGSGTQLALAVAAAARRLHGFAPDLAADARLLGRGNRSGIGIGLFDTGGLLVDGGRGPATEVPPVLARMPFPDAWRIVLILDPTCTGMHAEAEASAFAELAPMARADAATLCHLVLMQALPAVAERDIVQFGAAVREMQRRLGDHFAPRQGGRRFSSAKVAAALDSLDAAGAHGTGQSSWGPTGFAFAAGDAEAERFAAMLRHRFAADGLDIQVVRGLNRGAEITTIALAHEA